MTIYTSYLSRLNKIDKDITPILVSRYAPPSLKSGLYTHIPQLAPTAPVLRGYKTGAITINTLKDKYLGYLNDNRESIISLVNSELARHKKICLTCYEKDVKSCHREVLAKFLQDNGFEYGGEI